MTELSESDKAAIERVIAIHDVYIVRMDALPAMKSARHYTDAAVIAMGMGQIAATLTLATIEAQRPTNMEASQ